MLFDLENHPFQSASEFDVCIIGAGAVGLAMAQKFDGSGLSVAVLESGGQVFEAPTQALYGGENASFKEFPLESTRLRYLGGSTNHWGGMCRPLDEVDFLGRRGGFAAWPICRNELVPYYLEAQGVCDLASFGGYDTAAHPELAIDHPLIDLQGSLQPVMFMRSPPTRFGDKYLAAIEKSANVILLLHANVRNIVCDSSGHTVEEVQISTLGGIHAKVRAKRFVLAAGGLENARLLLLALERGNLDIGHSSDLVGRFYMDHIGAFLGKAVFSNPIEMDNPFFKEAPYGSSKVGTFLAPSRSLLEDQGCGNFRLHFSAGMDDDMAIVALQEVVSDLSQFSWPDELMTKLSIMMENADSVSNLAYKNIFDTTDRLFESTSIPTQRLANVRINFEQVANYESRITLSSAIDALGDPSIKFDWQLAPSEFHTLAVAANELSDLLGRSGAGRFKASSYLSAESAQFGISCHHSGTTRMSMDPSTGVVDEDLRVHGSSNLFVCGSSVFPTIGWANPTLTIVALSLRLVDRLLAGDAR